MVTSDFRPEVEIRLFRAYAVKNTLYKPYLWPNCQHFRVLLEIGVEEHDGYVRFLLPEVEMWPFCACAMHAAIIIGTGRSLWTWLWGRYHVPQNAFLVSDTITSY